MKVSIRSAKGLAVGVALLLAGCGSEAGSSAEAIPAHDNGIPAQVSWKVLYRASCASGAAETCRGAYGFTLLNDGSYEIGPGPKGELVSGRLQPRDFEALRAHLSKLRLSDFSVPVRAGGCKAPASGQGASAWLQLFHHETVRTLVSDSVDGLCFDAQLVSDDGSAHELEGWVAELAGKYYPGTFPNPCFDSISALEQGYTNLRRCNDDSDCAYIDENMLPIDAGVSRRVVVDDCSYIPPIAVANEFLAVTAQRELLLQRDLARRICGQDLTKSSCTHPLSFDPAIGAPVCREGVCQLNPKVEKGF